MRINLGTAISDLRVMLKIAQFAGGRSTLQLAYVLRILSSLGLRDRSRQSVLEVMSHHSEAGFYRAIENLTDAEWAGIIAQIEQAPSVESIESTRPRTWSPKRPSVGDLFDQDPKQPASSFTTPEDRQQAYDQMYEGHEPTNISERTQILNDPAVRDRRQQIDIINNPVKYKQLRDVAIQRRKELQQNKLQTERDELRKSLPTTLPDSLKNQLIDDAFRIAQVNVEDLASDWLSWMAEAGFDLSTYSAVVDLASHFDSPGARAVADLGEEQYVALWQSGAISEHDIDVESPRNDIKFDAPSTQSAPAAKPYPKSFGDQVLNRQYKPPHQPPPVVEMPPEAPASTDPVSERTSPASAPEVQDDHIELSQNTEIPTEIPWSKTVPNSKKTSTKADYLGMTKTLAPMDGFTWGQKIMTPAKQLGKTVDTRVQVRRPAGVGHGPMGLYVGQEVFISGMGAIGAIVIGARDSEHIVIAASNDSAGREYKMYIVPRAAIEQSKKALSIPGLETIIADQEATIWPNVYRTFGIKRQAAVVTMAQAIPTPNNLQQPEVPTVQPAAGPSQPVSTDGKPVQPGDYVQPINNAGGMNDPNTEGTVQQVNPDGSMIYETGTGEKRVQQPDNQSVEIIPQQ